MAILSSPLLMPHSVMQVQVVVIALRGIKTIKRFVLASGTDHQPLT
jgi:hypothetical protein